MQTIDGWHLSSSHLSLPPLFPPPPAPPLHSPSPSCPSPSQGMKSCQSRFLLLPTECSNTFNSMEEEESRGRSQVSGFVRFFEFLNSLRRASGLSRRSSTDSLSGRMSRVTSRDSLLVSSMHERKGGRRREHCVAWCESHFVCT